MRKLLFIILLTPILTGYTQSISFKASAPATVQVGQQFRLVFELNAKPKKLAAPEIKDFDVLSGPSTSSSSNIQIINGKMSQSVTYTYTYILNAVKEGTFQIQPAKATVDKETYTSNAITIKVVKGSAQSQQNKTGQQNQQRVNVAKSDEIYATISVSKKNVYVGEPVVATVKFFSQYDISQHGNLKLPTYDGFMVEEIDIPDPSFKREMINGKTHLTVLFQKVVLIPQITGSNTIKPFEWEIIYQVRTQGRSRSIFDDFFGGGYQNVKKIVKSKPVTINVKPLPDGKPYGYTGAVGTFKLNTSIDKNIVTANDAITLKVKISGNGNLKYIGAPLVNFPPDFEVYDPKININSKATTAGLTGTKTFEYLIIPRHAGEFRIPRFSFNYFDIASKQYKTLNSKEFNITVSKGSVEQEAVIVSGLSKEDVKYLGKDIRFIKTDNIHVYPIGAFFYGSTKFYLIYLVSIVIFIIIVIFWKNRIKQNANIIRLKNKKANKLAKSRLKTAQRYLRSNNKDNFYEEVVKALWGYLSDKLSIPLSDLSKETAKGALLNHKIKEEDISGLAELIDKCEFARFAPSSGDFNMEVAYADAVKIISKLENNLR